MRLLHNLPFIVTIIAVTFILALGFAADRNPAFRLRLLEVGYKFKNWRAFLRSIPQKVFLWAGVGLVAGLSLTVIRADGTIERLGVVSNRVVTTAGVAQLANSHLNTFENETFNYHDSGTGTTAEASSQTALVTATGIARVAGTQSSPSSGVYRTVATITYNATFAITEHGIFSASTSGTLLDRSVFAAVNVNNGDSIQFTYDLTYSAGG